MSYITAIILIFMGFVAGAVTISLCSINRAHDINAENDYLRAKYRFLASPSQMKVLAALLDRGWISCLIDSTWEWRK